MPGYVVYWGTAMHPQGCGPPGRPGKGATLWAAMEQVLCIVQRGLWRLEHWLDAKLHVHQGGHCADAVGYSALCSASEQQRIKKPGARLQPAGESVVTI